MIAATKNKREKKIFADSRQVAHIWAQQTQAYGANPSRNIYFEGASIWSYGSHFCLARFASPSVVLVNDNSYSVTTSRQQSDVRDALRGLPVTVIFVDDPRENRLPEVNQQRLWAEIIATAKKHRDARSSDHRDSIRRLLRNYSAYCHFTKRGRTKALAALLAATVNDPQFWAELAGCSKRAALEIDNEHEAQQGKIAKRSEATLARREAQRQHSQAMREAFCPLAIAAWREGAERFAVPSELLAMYGGCLTTTERALGVSVERFFNASYGYGSPTLLRIVGDEIQTSRGARVTVRAAVKAWPHLLAKQVPPQPVGQFTATSFEDGVLTIGCHRLPVSELNLIAAQLGLEGQLSA